MNTVDKMTRRGSRRSHRSRQAAPAEVSSYIAGVNSKKLRRDAESLIAIYSRAIGVSPTLVNNTVRYQQGQEPAGGFTVRKTAISVHLPEGTRIHASTLARLGPHTFGLGWVNISDLSQINTPVLEQLIRDSFQHCADPAGAHQR